MEHLNMNGYVNGINNGNDVNDGNGNGDHQEFQELDMILGNGNGHDEIDEMNGSSNGSGATSGNGNGMSVNGSDSSDTEQMLGPYQYILTKPPSAEVFKRAMGCKVCGNVGKSIRQCEAGHLLCGNQYDDQIPQQFRSLFIGTYRGNGGNGGNDGQAMPKCKNPDLKACPVPVVDENGDTVSCQQEVFDINLELYNLLYDACIMHCPATRLGCTVKVATGDLLAHMMDCPFSVSKQCPNSACKDTMILNDFVQHIVTKHGVPRFEGASNLINVYQDYLTLEISPYQWVAAVLEHEGNTFLLMVRQEDQFVVIWLTRVRAVNRDHKQEEFSCKISVQKAGVDNGSDSVATHAAHESWTGAVDTCNDWPFKTESETEKAFKLHLVRLLRYKTDELELQRYRWDVRVDLQLQPNIQE